MSASLLKLAPSARAWLAALATATVACGLLACGPTPPPESRVTMMPLEAPLTMNAEDHTASFTMDVLDPMYESLVRFDQNLNVAPSLATKWSVDASGTRWTLELRKGVRFHDGTPFDAQAVVDSFQRLLDPARGLAAASRVRGIVKRVTATGPDTVLFSLPVPMHLFSGCWQSLRLSAPWRKNRASSRVRLSAPGLTSFWNGRRANTSWKSATSNTGDRVQR